MGLVECPHHVVPTVFAKLGGMRPRSRMSQRDKYVEAMPLVLRLIQMILLQTHYLFGFASTFPNITDRSVWVEPLELFQIRWNHMIDKRMRRNKETKRVFRSQLIGYRSSGVSLTDESPLGSRKLGRISSILATKVGTK